MLFKSVFDSIFLEVDVLLALIQKLFDGILIAFDRQIHVGFLKEKLSRGPIIQFWNINNIFFDLSQIVNLVFRGHQDFDVLAIVENMLEQLPEILLILTEGALYVIKDQQNIFIAQAVGNLLKRLIIERNRLFMNLSHRAHVIIFDVEILF